MRSKTFIGALLAVLVVSGGIAGFAAAQETTTEQPTDDAQTTDQPSERETTADRPDRRPTADPTYTNLSTFLDQFDLTDREKQSIEDEVSEMRADGASAHAIRLVVHGRLHQYGVTHEDMREVLFEHRLDGKLDRLQDHYDLSDEDVETVRDAVETAREDGANPGELREVALDTLEELGYDVSDLRERWNERSARNWHRHDGDRDHRRAGR
ncbi:hypothetical protein ACFQJC_03545 [Haloferax namakaokahaiae]|uniref:Uncharacterized protein n=1 Tax=Haloferax namakaokahaiae TaxID=1748331 RepID=A0ABD5ZBM3_9EURY